MGTCEEAQSRRGFEDWSTARLKLPHTLQHALWIGLEAINPAILEILENRRSDIQPGVFSRLPSSQGPEPRTLLEAEPCNFKSVQQP